ncbi:MAG: hypothetical protein ACI4M0_06415, partial [Christensenellales bacterium]
MPNLMTICLIFLHNISLFCPKFVFFEENYKNFFKKTLDRVGATRSMLFVMGNVVVSMLSKKKTKRRLSFMKNKRLLA